MLRRCIRRVSQAARRSSCNNAEQGLKGSFESPFNRPVAASTLAAQALGRQESPGSLYPGYYRGNWGGALQRPAYLRTCSRCHARSWGCGCNDDEALGRVLPMVRNWFGRWPVGCGATSGDDAKWSRSSPYFVKRLAVSCASHEKRRVCLVMGTYRDSNGYIGIVHNRKQETEVLEKSAEPTLVLEGCLQIASGAHRTLQDACGYRARAALQSWHRVRAAAAKSLASRSCALSSLMALHVRYFHDCRAGPGSRGARCNCAGSAGCRAGGPQTRQCRTCYSHSTYRWKLVSSAIASADGAVFWSWLEPGWTWVCEHGCAALSGARFAKGFLDSNWPARRAAIFSYGVVGLTRPLAKHTDADVEPTDQLGPFQVSSKQLQTRFVIVADWGGSAQRGAAIGRSVQHAHRKKHICEFAVGAMNVLCFSTRGASLFEGFAKANTWRSLGNLNFLKMSRSACGCNFHGW